MIKNATFTSVWDGGFKITTQCKVNNETKEVFDIVSVENKSVDILDEEYITIDGNDFKVSHESDKGDNEYYYK